MNLPNQNLVQNIIWLKQRPVFPYAEQFWTIFPYLTWTPFTALSLRIILIFDSPFLGALSSRWKFLSCSIQLCFIMQTQYYMYVLVRISFRIFSLCKCTFILIIYSKSMSTLTTLIQLLLSVFEPSRAFCGCHDSILRNVDPEYMQFQKLSTKHYAISQRLKIDIIERSLKGMSTVISQQAFRCSSSNWSWILRACP